MLRSLTFIRRILAALLLSALLIQQATGEPAATESLAVPQPAANTAASLYQNHCAACHDQPFYKAPSRTILSALGPDRILKSMNEGVMKTQAAAIEPADRGMVAEFISGRRLSDIVEPQLPPLCTAARGFDPAQVPVSRGWGVDLENSRFQPAASGGLHAGNVGNLEVKWSFAYPNAVQARSQPVFGGGAIYVGSQDGTVWALDAETGCLRWRFAADAEVRTGIAITPWEADDAEVDPLIFFGDMLANVYALDARSGTLRWRLKADDHRDATMTGTPVYFRERLYIPVSSLEVVAAADPSYECCSFRGALLAVDAATGRTIWKSFTTDEAAKPAGKTSVGTIIKAPSGAPIWSAPTIDERRERIYVGTGENYSSPADGNSDAIIAYDLHTGRKLWVSQQTAKDAWNVACFIGIPGFNSANCPVENGPDHDFGSHPILIHLDAEQDILVAGQKSGHAMGIDPDTGKTLWKTAVGRGGVQGGVHFGIAAEADTLYVPINDLVFAGDDARYDSGRPAAPGVHAVDARTGVLRWSATPSGVCGDLAKCNPGVSHAIAAIPGAVIAGFLDGRLRIYARQDGRLLWERNMLGEYTTVSGEIATGGAFSGGGVLVAHGRLYVNAGYGYNNHIPGNALVVLGPAEEQ